METLRFSQRINEPREKVWDVMLSDATYRKWTSVFNPGGSYYEGSWDEGETIRFYGPDPVSGKLGGMLSRIKENRKPEFISIEHFGMIVDGVEDTSSDEVKKWTPAYENYTFNEMGNSTEVVVEIQIVEEYAKMMTDTWPKALEALRDLAEKS